MNEIIVDGVDVSGCDRLRTFRDWTYSSDKWCGISNDGGCECEQNPNCLYKRVKQLEQTLKDIRVIALGMTKDRSNVDTILSKIHEVLA